ncbi:imidazole glycerol phosphate synthase subunit HisH, partial [Rickettsiales bacterium]|nr:imidazole glycerol phosphate synthase subunit HisH [Rickettsiales bacterium]
MSKKIVIIDYNSGNIRSVFNALESIKKDNEEILISNKISDIQSASHLILPGVGSFSDCAKGLSTIQGMIDEIKNHIKKDRPFLGICVGMQLLAEFGYEGGKNNGLNFISGDVIKINDDDNSLKIPHIGWNNLEIQSNHKILSGIAQGDHFYFVHSYHFKVQNSENIIAQVSYG